MEREKTMKMETVKISRGKKHCFMMTQNIATSHVSSSIITTIHSNNRITKRNVGTKLRGKMKMPENNETKLTERAVEII